MSPTVKQANTKMTAVSGMPSEFEQININAAGIDIGAQKHVVAVPKGRDPQGRDIRHFDTFTTDLYALVDWLKQCHIDTVAMESTGIYWIPLFESLEQKGFEVRLVNPRSIKHAPGRKSDVVDLFITILPSTSTTRCWGLQVPDRYRNWQEHQNFCNPFFGIAIGYKPGCK